MREELSTAGDIDYRASHLRPGRDYDAEIAAGPLDSYMARRESEMLPALIRRLFPQGICRSLDFACGTGRITRLVEPLAAESFAIDVSPDMIDVARARCRSTTFVIGDATRNDIGLPPMQLITAFRFFGNAQDELRSAALRSFRRLIASDGMVVLNNHRNPLAVRNMLVRLAGGPLPCYRGRTIDLSHWKLRTLLREAGFRMTATYGIAFWIVRTTLERHDLLNSRAADVLERLSRCPGSAPFCRDVIVVARPI